MFHSVPQPFKGETKTIAPLTVNESCQNTNMKAQNSFNVLSLMLLGIPKI